MIKILKLTGKYSEDYYDISTPEKLEQVVLGVFKERFIDNSEYFLDLYEEPEKVEFPQSVLDLPDNNKIKKAALMELKTYEINLKEYKNRLEEFEWIKKVYETKNIKKMIKYLKGRNGYEYEGFEIIEPRQEY